ncbi:MAG: anthranilate synthase component I family protein [Planctomycetes bacterium]|nr:anthranilate synthase component I family protein [Planctomycetota bacterium]
MNDLVACVEPLPDWLTPGETFQRLSCRPHCLFLDSALRDAELGRYSFVAADPFAWVRCGRGQSAALEQLRSVLREYCSESLANLPPFQGGAAGLFAYSLGEQLEQLPRPRIDEFQIPDLAVGIYDVVAAFDHRLGKGWLISQGFPESTMQGRRQRAAARLREFGHWLREPDSSAATRRVPRMPTIDPAPGVPLEQLPGLRSNFTAEGYRQMVARAVEYIRAGDIFQVNLSQRLLFPAQASARDLYLRLRDRNPATFAGYFDAGEFQIISASPERFLKLQAGVVETRPIKGTRRRLPQTETDLFLGDELQESVKDRAENVMIVDLMRNDLSRVCIADSVRVNKLCGLEVYETVQHLVSVVQAQLEPDQSAFDLLKATFPGGSVTGAPKVRAMQIIAELEPTARGAYCGSLGYVGFDGTMDLSILIRTVTAAGGWWQFPVGGGIVAQSKPRLEYEETWHKAAGILRALRP